VRDRSIFITESDARRLRGLLAARARSNHDQEHLHELGLELERAHILRTSEVPADAVTVNTRVRVLDLTSGEQRELMLVFPEDADLAAQRISVLAPLGTALLGYREGDEVDWVMPGGLRRLRVERVWRVAPSVPYETAKVFASTVGAGSHP
jgi:regulator of nucleoside diphosphate kinase